MTWIPGWQRIQQERMRQVTVEGWTDDHDDKHDNGEMAKAAICYALSGLSRHDSRDNIITERAFWPSEWDESWFKPDRINPTGSLVKAGALIAAEIDRLQRAMP